jgi:hypothetical protein
MSLYASWVHGNAVTVEAPQNLDRVGHYGWGGDMAIKPGKDSWFHIPVPTPVIVNDARSRLDQEFNGLLLEGEHRTGLDGQNTFVLTAPHTVIWGIGISFYFIADIGFDTQIPDARLILGAAGGDFYI